jgi:hypothetical protein
VKVDLFTAKPVVGIDPGLSGAVARLHGDKLTILRDFKFRKDISRAVRSLTHDAALVVIEAVHAMPGEGVCSVFSFGKSTGTAFGALDIVHTQDPVEVPPQTWQNFFKKLFGITEKKPFKEMTQELAAKLFPAEKQLFLARKKDHNSADAALMAAYGVLCLQKQLSQPA